MDPNEKNYISEPFNLNDGQITYDPLTDAYMGASSDNIFSWLFGDQQQAKEFLQQRYLQQDSQNYDWEKMLFQLNWNSEPEKMKRMAEAGYNPFMLSGQMGSSPTVSSGSPSSPHVNPITSRPIDTLANVGKTIGSMVADVSGGMQSVAGSRMYDSQTFLNNVISGLKPMETEAQINLWNATAEKYVKDGLLSDANASWVNEQAKFFASTIDVRADKLQEDLNVARNEAIKISKETSYLEKKEENLAKEGNVLDSQEKLYKQQTAESAERTNLIKIEQETQREINTQYGISNERERWANDQINDMFGQLPYPIDWSRVASLYATGKEEDRIQADNMIKALCDAYASQYNQQIQSAFENYGKEFLMNLGNGAIDMLKNVPYMFNPFGRGGRVTYPSGTTYTPVYPYQ